ncbi:transcriptional repressor p66 alpha [Tetranychus urticae]|uniref:Transcriptional repressor p66 coiled-coil MBD2-interaction domain-containing protein n=1 Tax=Tetranychus urticae TaxID=32264 RepID=T1KIN7_TETUR|nr:transcriptional repressor p66 alpha [Tetranychus urticae]
MSDLVENHTLMDSLDDLMQNISIDEFELREKEKRIRKLTSILKNEENKLTLMKKVRQSQSQGIHHQRSTPPAHSHSHHHPTPPAHSHSVYNTPPAHSHHHQSPALAAHQQAHVQPPTIRAAHQSRSTTVLNPPITHNRSVNSYGAHPPPPLGLPSHRSNALSAPVIRGPPTSHHHQSLLRPGYHSLNRTPVTTPPNVVLGYPVQDLRAQQSLSHTPNQVKPVRQSDIQVPSNACSSPLANEINQTPAQRLAAAKAALKKQLEKTLLQIVPPKPPPPDLHFIPNANNNEFIYYYGLETIVDFLTGFDQNKSPPEPFECVKCNTDFTPAWKWQDSFDSNQRKLAVCESCVSSNIKKKLRDEHSKRLKTAFYKALQQEQEIEQKISSGAPSPPVPALTPPINSTQNNSQVAGLSNLGNSTHGFGNSSVLPQAPPAHSSFPRHGSAAAAAAAAASATASAAALAASALFTNLPKLTPAQQSLFQAQLQQLAQSLNPQSLSQPQPAHMLPFAPLLYQYGALMNNNDVHRQYLLDMIPPRSLGP